MKRRAAVKKAWRIAGAALVVSGIAYAQTNDAPSADPPPTHGLRDRYEQVLVGNPQRGTAFDRLYKDYADSQELPAWVEHLNQLANTSKQGTAYRLILGYVNERQGNDQAALKAYEQVIAQDATNSRALGARGILLARLRRNDEAAASLKQAIDLKPPRQEIQELYKTLGRAYAAAGHLDQAAEAWLALANLFPQDTATREELAGLLADAGRIDDAAAQYESLRLATSDASQKTRAVFAIAQLRVTQGKPEQAISLLSGQLESLAPDSWQRVQTCRQLEQVLSRAGGLEAVAGFYAKWIHDHPNDIDIRLAAAGVLRRMGKSQEAIATYQSAIEAVGSRSDVRLALAEVLLESGRRDEAVEQYRKVAELQPSDAGAWERLGQVLFNDPGRTLEERQRLAIQAWRNIADKSPSDPIRAVRAAEVFRAAQLTPEALEYYDKASALAPEQAEYREYAALYLNDLGRREEAIARLQKTVEGPRGTAMNWTRLAELLVRLKAAPQSLAAIDRAIELTTGDSNPQLRRLQSMRVGTLVELKQYKEAASAIDRLESLSSSIEQAREARQARVDLHQLQNDLPQATTEQATKTGAQADADGLEMLAMYYRAGGHQQQAVETIDRVIKLDPDKPARLELAAAIHRDADDFAQAILLMRQLIKLQPQRRVVYVEQIAEMADKINDLDVATTQANELIALAPDAPRGYLLASNLFSRMGKTDEAIDVLKQGIKKNQRESELYVTLAQLQVRAGRPDDAAETYRRFFETATDNAEKLRALTELGHLQIAAGNADAFFNRLIEYQKDADREPIATVALAAGYREAGQPDRAQSILEQSLLGRPNDLQGLGQLIDLAHDHGQFELALDYAKRLQTLKPQDALIHDRVGELLFETGHVQEAIKQWHDSPESGRRNPADIVLQLARTLMQRQMDAQATKVLMQATTFFTDDWRLAYEATRMIKEAGHPDQTAGLLDHLIDMPVPPDAFNDTFARHPNVSYLGYHGRNPLLNQWVNLPTIQSRVTAEINFEAAARTLPPGTSIAVMRYNPPDLASTQLAALICRLHLAQQQGQLRAYLNQLAKEAGYRLPEMPSDMALDTGSAKARVRLVRVLLLLNLTQQAQLATRQFLKEDPRSADMAVLDAVFTLSVGCNASNLGLTGTDSQVTTDRIEEAIGRVRESAPQVMGDIGLLIAESYLAHNQTTQAQPWIAYVLTGSTSLENRIGLLGGMVRANDGADARKLMASVVPDLRKMGQSRSNVLAPVFLENMENLEDVAGQALRRETRDIGPDLCVACLDILASCEFGRTVVTQGQSSVEVFGLQESQKPMSVPTFPQPIALVGAELSTKLQRWAQAIKTASAISRNPQVPILSDDLVARLTAWYQQAQPGHRAFPLATTAMFLGYLDRPDVARALLEEGVKTEKSDDIRLMLVHLLITRKELDQALAVLNTVEAPVGPLAREALVSRLLITATREDRDGARLLVRRLDGMELSPQERQGLNGFMERLGMGSPTSQAAKPVRSATPPIRSAPPVSESEQLTSLLQANNASAVEILATRIIAEKSGYALALMSQAPEIVVATTALEQINRLDGCIAVSEKTAAAQPADPGPAQKLLILYNATGQTQKASQLLARLIQASPSQLILAGDYAMFLYSQARFSEAAVQFDVVLANKPQLVQGGAEVYETYRQAHRLDDLMGFIKAIKPVDRLAIVQESDRPFEWVGEVARFLKDQNPEQSLVIWRKYQELSNDSSATMPDIPAKLDGPLPGVLPTPKPSPLQQTIDELRTANRSNEAYARLAEVIFNPQPKPAKISESPEAGIQELFFVRPDMSRLNSTQPGTTQLGATQPGSASQPQCLLSELVALAKQTGKLDDLRAIIAKQSSSDPWHTLIAKRCELLIAIETDDAVHAQALMARTSPDLGAIAEWGYDPSLSIVVLRGVNQESLVGPSLNLLVRMCRTACATDLGKAQAIALIQAASARLVETGHRDQLADLFKRLAPITPLSETITPTTNTTPPLKHEGSRP